MTLNKDVPGLGPKRRLFGSSAIQLIGEIGFIRKWKSSLPNHHRSANINTTNARSDFIPIYFVIDAIIYIVQKHLLFRG